MATKQSPGSKPDGRSAGHAPEPVPARALQSLILVVGVLLLFTVMFGGRWGPGVVGVLVFISAFPPLRRHVDRWLVGKDKGDEAEQAAIIRMAAGILIVILAAAGIL
jgi:hypothetical protein